MIARGHVGSENRALWCDRTGTCAKFPFVLWDDNCQLHSDRMYAACLCQIYNASVWVILRIYLHLSPIHVALASFSLFTFTYTTHCCHRFLTVPASLLYVSDSPAPVIEFSLDDASPHDREIYVLITLVLSTALTVLACVFVRCAWLRQGNVRPQAEEVRASAVGEQAAQLDKLVAREEEKDRETYAEHADVEAFFPFFKDATEELVSSRKAPNHNCARR